MENNKAESDWFELPQTKNEKIKILKRIKYPGECKSFNLFKIKKFINLIQCKFM